MDMEKEATPLLEYKKSRTYPSGILSFHLRPLYWSWWVMQQANKTHNLVPTLLYWAQYPFFPPSSIKSPFSKFVQTSRTVPLQSEISPHIQHWLMETEKPSSFLSRSLRTATKIKHIITNI